MIIALLVGNLSKKLIHKKTQNNNKTFIYPNYKPIKIWQKTIDSIIKHKLKEANYQIKML